MEKDNNLFDLWNKEKKFIEFYRNKLKLVKRWEIWIAKIWVNIWSEISKDWEFSRPVFVFKTHLWWDLIFVIPFTTKFSNNYKDFLYEFSDYKNYWLNQKSYLILNQFKVMSLKRLERKLNDTTKKWIHYPLVDENIINDISNKLKNIVFNTKKEPINL